MVGIKRLIHEAKKHLPLAEEAKQSSSDKPQSEADIPSSTGEKTQTAQDDASKCVQTVVTSESHTEEETAPVKGKQTHIFEGSETTVANSERQSAEETDLSKESLSKTQSNDLDSSTEPNAMSKDKANDGAEGHLSSTDGKEE